MTQEQMHEDYKQHLLQLRNLVAYYEKRVEETKPYVAPPDNGINYDRFGTRDALGHMRYA